jgi:heme A synthase
LSANLVTLFMLVEALIGAGLVLFELVGENQSVVRAASGAVHLANTFLLLGSLFLTGWLASTGKSIELGNKRGLVRLLLLGGIGLILIGSSGAIAALGDTLYPSDTLSQGIAADFDPSAPLLVKLRTAHPVVAIAVSALILVLSRFSTETSGQELSYAAVSVRLILIVQLIAGVINWLLLAPIWLQIFHLLLADLAVLSFSWWSAEILASSNS